MAAPQASTAAGTTVLVATHNEVRLPRGAQPAARIGDLRFFDVPVAAGTSARDGAQQLAGRAGVVAAQPNTAIPRASVSGTCVDAPRSTRLDIATTTKARSRLPPARTRPIAVLDTGVDPATPELAGRVLQASDAIGGPPTGLPDDDGHGTQAAAAAAGAPGLVAGVSPTSPIIPVRIATASQLATPESIVKGLELAVTRRARVAVLPSSQPLIQTSETAVSAVSLAVNAAFDAGVIVVAPAGNEGRGERVFPGGLAHLLTVGSSGPLAVRDPFSNFGPWIDVVAPGAELVLPAPRALCPTGYASASGTSFSAAAVAGAVALVAAARPRLSPSSLYDLIRREAVIDAGLQGFDVNTGFGLLDVGAGLVAPAPRSDPHELNDNVYWLKRRPTKFATYLRRTRRTTTRGSVSPGKDPQDAFKVFLSRNDIVRARVRSADTSALLYVSVWGRGTGAFDMRLPATDSELRDSGGFTQNPAVSYRATSPGTYYVTVFAPDLRAPSDPTAPGALVPSAAPPHMAYWLALDKRCSRSRTLRVPLDRLRRRGARMKSITTYVDATPRSRRSRGALRRKLTLHGLRNGRHRIVFRATFAAHRRTSSSTTVRVRCSLRLRK